MLRNCLLLAASAIVAAGQALPEHPAIGYADVVAKDPVAELNRRIRAGEVHLKFEDPSGYLRSVLAELHIPIDSQMAVFAKTSLQAAIIGPRNPRTIFFNDSAVVGWVRGEPFVEAAAQDPRQGTIFYTLDQHTLDQQRAGQPQFQRRDDCLTCHLSHSSLGVPGLLLRSVFPSPTGAPERRFGDYDTDQTSPFEQRWGGWFVTGNTGALQHMGNRAYSDPSNVEAHAAAQVTLETGVHLSPNSDVAALMVFDHQVRMVNLLTRFGWDLRAAAYDRFWFDLSAETREIVDYMLFIGEAPLPAKVQGTAGFAETFAAAGPRDAKGRSLKDLDLTRRLMRYPCSYLIYSDAFDALPPEGREAIYRRMWRILSGQEHDARYATLSNPDRQAILEILRATKKGLPDFFFVTPREASGQSYPGNVSLVLKSETAGPDAGIRAIQ